MAPNPLYTVEENLKAIVNSLFNLQATTHGYLGNESQRALIDYSKNLVQSLQTLSTTAGSIDTLLTPEIIQYVEEGRNPDIYTREFVELIQRNNSYLKGKSEALKEFRDALADDLVQEWPEMKEVVDSVVAGKGGGMSGVKGMDGAARMGIAEDEKKDSANGAMDTS